MYIHTAWSSPFLWVNHQVYWIDHHFCWLPIFSGWNMVKSPSPLVLSHFSEFLNFYWLNPCFCCLTRLNPPFFHGEIHGKSHILGWIWQEMLPSYVEIPAGDLPGFGLLDRAPPPMRCLWCCSNQTKFMVNISIFDAFDAYPLVI